MKFILIFNQKVVIKNKKNKIITLKFLLKLIFLLKNK